MAAPTIAPRSVRLSVTDRCDFACTYCRPPEDIGYLESRLSLRDWGVLLQGLVDSGIRRVRLTGGEPLLVRDVAEIVAMASRLGVSDLSITTNGSQLERHAEALKKAGLMRINISIDSLRPETFRAMTRGGDLAKVLRGIQAARRVGLQPIKLNTVVVRGQNDDELVDLVEFAWANDLVPRFLEVMAIGEGANLPAGLLVSVAEMRKKLSHLLTEPLAPEPDRGPARYAMSRHLEGRRVGFISGATDTYCSTCDRLRVSSDGVVRPCLATEDGLDVRPELAGGDVEAVVRAVRAAWLTKPDGNEFKGCTEPSAARVSMRAIGG